MDSLHSMLRWVTLGLAGAFFISIIGASLFFFKVDGAYARRGKGLVSVLGGMAIPVDMLCIYLAPARPWWAAVAAVCVFVLALSLFWSAYAVNRRRPLAFAFSAGAPSHLVTLGPYRWIRHPFYASYLAGWIGAVLAAPGVATLLVLVVMATLYWVAARKEERLFLESSLGRQYLAYRRHAGLFTPRLNHVPAVR